MGEILEKNILRINWINLGFRFVAEAVFCANIRLSLLKT